MRCALGLDRNYQTTAKFRTKVSFRVLLFGFVGAHHDCLSALHLNCAFVCVCAVWRPHSNARVCSIRIRGNANNGRIHLDAAALDVIEFVVNDGLTAVLLTSVLLCAHDRAVAL